jgi:hypothetical protein
LAAGDAQPGGPAPIEILAITGEPFPHWYWGMVCFDMAGFQTHKQRLPLDYIHDDREVLGYLDRFAAADDGLSCSGQIIPFRPDDRATEILHKARAGVPYEASILFELESSVIEDVPAGAAVPVNGRMLAGPCTVIRQWPLRGVAVCPYGADKHTETQLAAGQAGATILVTVQETAMTQPVEKPEAKPAETPPAETPPAEKPAETPPAETPAGETPAGETKPEGGETPPPAAAAEQALTGPAECARYLAAFGAKGAEWYAAGLSFEAAGAKHAAALQAENQQLRDRLQAITGGEPAALSQNPDPGDKPADRKAAKHRQNLGPNLGRFAAGIVIKK